MSEIELKPCPFCGNKPIHEDRGGTYYYRYHIFCEKCGASVPHEHIDEIAISRWNARHSCKCNTDDMWTHVCGYKE